MDDWNASATARAAASGKATNPTKSVTLTQARFFMDDSHGSIPASQASLTTGREGSRDHSCHEPVKLRASYPAARST